MNMRKITSLTMLISFLRDLGKKNITVHPEQTFKEIAADNDTDPHALFEVLHGLVVQ